MTPKLTIPAFIGIFSLFSMNLAGAEEKSSPALVNYTKQIKPLLAQRCVSCHGPLRQRGGLRLDAGKLIRKGGDSGAAVIAAKPLASLLLHALEGTNDASRMPVDGKPLKKEEIALIRRWIAEGAQSPKDETIAADPRDHWAFKKPVRPPLPKLKDTSWVKNPIDAFIAARHQRQGVKPQPPAKKSVLLRRVYIDLIGLPPTPKQLRAFLADNSADAYEKVVDELLKSPRYGERWGRHWMDVWRYSDWYGYRKELRNSARHIWRWRDWIVESLNEDRPYHEMVADMLAADERAPEDAGRLRATGFLARHYYKFNRNVWLDSTIEHTGKAFLGMTFNCARCHDHMYDPIGQKEYYRLRAIFEPYRVRTRRVAGQPDPTKDGIPIAYDANLDVKTYVFDRGNDKYPDKEHPVSAAFPEILSSSTAKIETVQLPAAAWYPGFRREIRDELLKQAQALVKRRETELKKAELDFAAATRLLEKRQRRKTRKPARARRPRTSRRRQSAPFPSIVDTFAKARPDLWTLGDGKWTYRDGRLIQSQVAGARQWIRSKATLPRDFTVVLRFRTTGGTVYKSVGVSFDDDEKGHAESVYLSAYAAGPKVQVAHVRGGKSSYPPAGAKRLKVDVGKEHELRIDIHDRLLNVTVDGKRQLVYQLPAERRTGRLSLWTYDATAEFLHLQVSPLGTSAKLVGRQPAKSIAKAVANPASAVKLAGATLRSAKAAIKAARSSFASLKARIDADDARYAAKPAANAGTLAATASKAEKLATLHQAEAVLAGAERSLLLASRMSGTKKAKTRAVAIKAQAAAKKKLTAANVALAKNSSTYSSLTPTYPKNSSGRRLAMARWIADRNNPLTARVAVNHIWMRHFGKPLVPTVFDFGKNGKPPTHPLLLDWLAVEFMAPSTSTDGKDGPREGGWSMKKLHRIIVTSNAYRMSSSMLGAAESNRQIDPDNKLLWRMNAVRMESEIVRDSVLRVSGQLDLKTGGPEVDAKLGQTTFRRSIYYRHAPEKFMTFLKLFDGASTNECYRRNETVVPQQALALVNSTLALAQSRKLTSLIRHGLKNEGRPVSDESFVTALFEITLCRKPTAAERSTCATFLKQQASKLATPGKLTKTVGGPKVAVPPAADPHWRARENLSQVLLNHHEFVTRR